MALKAIVIDELSLKYRLASGSAWILCFFETHVVRMKGKGKSGKASKLPVTLLSGFLGAGKTVT